MNISTLKTPYYGKNDGNVPFLSQCKMYTSSKYFFLEKRESKDDWIDKEK